MVRSYRPEKCHSARPSLSQPCRAPGMSPPKARDRLGHIGPGRMISASIKLQAIKPLAHEGRPRSPSRPAIIRGQEHPQGSSAAPLLGDREPPIPGYAREHAVTGPRTMAEETPPITPQQSARNLDRAGAADDTGSRPSSQLSCRARIRDPHGADGRGSISSIR